MTPEEEAEAIKALHAMAQAIQEIRASTLQTETMMEENLEIAKQYKTVLGDPLERGQLIITILKTVVLWFIGVFGSIVILQQVWTNWIKPLLVR